MFSEETIFATQENRFVVLKTPLAENTLLFKNMTGQEALGRLFEYEIDCLSENRPLDNPTALLGKDMTVSLTLNSGGKRHFHGFVSSIRHQSVQNNAYSYRVVLRPWLWFLTRSSHCRIFQHKSVPDILQAVLSDYQSLGTFKLNLTHTERYKPRDYCVQYRESDFNFVSRLMEYEGIFYFFQHENDKHTLVIGDDIGVYQDVNDFVSIPYFPPDKDGRTKQDHIYAWHTAHRVQSGRYALMDYDFEMPNFDLFTQANFPKSHTHADGAHYDYPGNYHTVDTGQHYSDVRLEELQSEYEVSQGSCNALGMTVGMLFALKDHYLDSENGKHSVIEAYFSLSSSQYLSGAGGESHYECHFKAIRDSQLFRSQRLTPTPFVQGPQTAVVVGKQGEEIWTDKYGRVKVQFHWDRDGKHNDESSCWIRVATPIAGSRWGWVSLPRMGQEVVVSFLEGNPDRPLITGSVYNANQMPPYALPANQTQSGLKTRSSKEGNSSNFNELRFEDKKGSEQVYLHAEKNLDTMVEHNETLTVGADRTKKIGDNESITVGGFKTETIMMASAETVLLAKAETIGLGKVLSVGIDYAVSVGKDLIVTAGDSISLTAGESISLTVGDAQLIMKKDGSVTLYGSRIEVFGTEHIHLGSKLIDLDDVIETFDKYDEKFMLVDEETGEALANYDYEIHLEDGSILNGTTNEQGLTIKTPQTNNSQRVKIYVK